MTVRTNIKIGTLIAYIGMVMSLLLHLFYTPFLLKSVGDESYGLYSFATSFAPYLSIVLGMLASSYNKYASSKEATNPSDIPKMNGTYSALFLILSLIVAIVSIAITLLLGLGGIHLQAYTPESQRTIALVFFFSSIQVVVTILTRIFTLHANHNNKFIVLRSTTLAITLGSSLLCIPFLLAGHGIITVAIVVMAVNCLGNLALVAYDVFLLRIRISLRGCLKDKGLIKAIFGFSSIILLNEICSVINSNADRIILGFYGYDREVALYTLGLTIVSYVEALASNISLNLSPKIFDNAAKDNASENKRYFALTSRIFSAMWVLLMGGFACCGEDFVHLWLGSERSEVYWILLTLLAISFLPETQLLCADMERAIDKHRVRALIILGSTILNVALTIIGVHFGGRAFSIQSCLICTAIAKGTMNWAVLTFYNFKTLGLNWREYLGTIGAYTLIGACSFAPCFLLRRFALQSLRPIFSLLITGFLFVFVFGLLCFVFRKKDVLFFRSLLHPKPEKDPAKTQ